MILRRGLILALLGACGTLASATQYFTSYHVTLEPEFSSPVTNIMMFEEHNSGGSATWAFQAAGGATSVLNNPFPHNPVPVRSFLMGITQDLPGDPEGQKHVVLFMDDFAASLTNHIAWGTIFRNTLESDLIAALELATSGQDWPIIQPGLNFIDAFNQGDARNILGPGGFTYSAYFQTGGTFSVMAFSDGTQIGQGFSAITAVPEPASLAALGLGAIAFLRKRRK
jgi:hypothetical protein